MWKFGRASFASLTLALESSQQAVPALEGGRVHLTLLHVCKNLRGIMEYQLVMDMVMSGSSGTKRWIVLAVGGMP